MKLSTAGLYSALFLSITAIAMPISAAALDADRDATSATTFAPQEYLRLAASSEVKECKKACAEKYNCSQYTAVPGTPNPDKDACLEKLRACKQACK